MRRGFNNRFHSGAANRFYDAGRFRRRGRHRLLHHDMLACPGGGDRVLRVTAVGTADDDRIDIVAKNKLACVGRTVPRAPRFFRPPGTLLNHVAGGNKFRLPGDLGQVGAVGDIAAANDSKTNFTLHYCKIWV